MTLVGVDLGSFEVQYSTLPQSYSCTACESEIFMKAFQLNHSKTSIGPSTSEFEDSVN